MGDVVKLRRTPVLAETLNLNEEEHRLLHHAMFFPGRKDSRPALVAAARSDIPILPDLIAKCIKEAGRLEQSSNEELLGVIESIVLAGLKNYEEVVFPSDRLKHKNLVRGAALISGVISEFCAHLSYREVDRLRLTSRSEESARKWAYDLLVGDRQKVTLDKAGRGYAEAIISDSDFTCF
ncbi:hypothetical protein [Halomonas sp. I5-271120]|uniref:hypothetical protein n=1 Tax=Halomonas sp. I5-271120 TaxID=3061632 RepID=UPI0027150991|nr:hypothetical protein [Halomonas sp. I5-271120]